jgi:hypothetical protein
VATGELVEFDNSKIRVVAAGVGLGGGSGAARAGRRLDGGDGTEAGGGAWTGAAEAGSCLGRDGAGPGGGGWDGAGLGRRWAGTAEAGVLPGLGGAAAGPGDGSRGGRTARAQDVRSVPGERTVAAPGAGVRALACNP